MQHRGTRLAILCVLLAAGALAGFSVWSAERAVRRLDEAREDKITTVDRLLSSISTIASAQQDFADYGRRDLASFTRVSVLVDRLTTDAAGLRAAPGSAVSGQRLEEFWTALSALMGAETRARERFASGDEGGAADAVLASARDSVTVLGSSLKAFRAAEQENYRATRTAAMWRSWASVGSVAGLWAIGLVAFAALPWPRGWAVIAATTPASEPLIDIPLTRPVSVPAVDLKELAGLSVGLSRLSDQAALAGLLAQSAALMDARGIIIWMGAGTELFAVAAHGYDEALLARIRPIARDADNATADAWRSGELRRVPADSSGRGAICAPLLGPTGCAGVFAVEVGSERDDDGATQAVAVIVASQLAGVLAAWPTASTTAIEIMPLDRKAAAS
jgi:hypothetical protein